MVLLCLTCLTSPPKSKLCPEEPVVRNRPSIPPHVVAQRAPGCNRSSRRFAVLESHRAVFCLGEAAASVEAASTSLGHPANSKKCSQRLQLATVAAQPQNLLPNLNSEEPANPTPSMPDPELSYTRLIAGSVPVGAPSTHPLAIVTRTLLPRLHFHLRCSCGRWRSCCVPV